MRVLWALHHVTLARIPRLSSLIIFATSCKRVQLLVKRVHPKKVMDHAALRSDLRSQKS